MHVPILMYHSIADSAHPLFQEFTIAPERFAAQMAYLDEQGYTPLTVSQFVDAKTLPEKPIVLTFDDGFTDFYTNALPILQQHAFTATLYIVTAYIGGTSRWLEREGESNRPILSWDQIQAVHQAGIEIGGHTHTHPQLDMLSNAVARREIVQCKQILDDHLGAAVTSFAYPFGYFSDRTRRIVQEAGYTSACAVKLLMSAPDDDRFELSRLIVRGDTSLDEFAQLLVTPTSRVTAAQVRVKAEIWRLVRRATLTVSRRDLAAVHVKQFFRGA